MLLGEGSQWEISVWPNQSEKTPSGAAIVIFASVVSISEAPQLAFVQGITYEGFELDIQCLIYI